MDNKIFKPDKKDWLRAGIFFLLILLLFLESVRAIQEFDKADTDIIIMIFSTLLGYCIKKVIQEFKQKKDQE